ncbi:MAG: hypothetical protein JRG71_04380 [Deltaproteobacteria bacterium]|nr:hypothetical protein [Deltaproteobacteria bacterium]
MKRIVVMSLVAFTLLFSTSAFAVGLGVFVDYSSGSGDLEVDGLQEVDIDSDMFAGGFVLDTAPTNESVFNYRLNIGITDQTIDIEDDFELDLNGVYIENIFGFALIKNENFRWWLGPLIRIGYYEGDIYDVDVEVGEFGGGVVTGLNFKAGSVVLSPSVGVRYSAFYGEIGHVDFDADTVTVFANVAVLF